MRFDQPAGPNPIDRGLIVGKPYDRIEGPLKVTGTAPYAYERHDVAPNAAYGWVVTAPIGRGVVNAIDTREAEAAAGVLAVVTYENAGTLHKGRMNTAKLLGGPEIQHYDQALGVVVAETLEQARYAARLVRVDCAEEPGRYDLDVEKANAFAPPQLFGGPGTLSVGNFDSAFAKAAVKIDQNYSTPGHSHAMMEPHATTAAWEDGKLTLWSATQMVAWTVREMAQTLDMDPQDIRVVAPYIGGGFGAKLFLRADALLAALGARATGRPVKVALARAQIPNNTVHRPATLQRIRIGADSQGVIDAIAHESWSGDQKGGKPEGAAMQTRLLYRGDNQLTAHNLAVMDLPEGNAMRAPGEAVGMLALEIAMDELAEAAGIDPVEVRIRNDVQHDPAVGPSRPYSGRKLIECLRDGADRFGWSKRNPKPGQVRDGQWLIGMGVASAFRNNMVLSSGARILLGSDGKVTVETDMTDVGTGSYTIIGQTAAEMMGVPLESVEVRLGDSRFPESAGSGGQFGANSATAGVYAACVMLRGKLTQKLGLNSEDAIFEDGMIKSAGRVVSLAEAAGPEGMSAEDKIEFGNLTKTFAQATFGAHFCEVGVNMYTGETRVRRMLGVFQAGRILNPKSARNQIIGSMTMGVGAALMEELIVDTRYGFFVNHDMAEYQIPVHADIPEQEVIFLDDLDDKSSPMKAKGVGELGICGAGAAVANAIYNACGVRLRDYPLTIDKIIAGMSDELIA